MSEQGNDPRHPLIRRASAPAQQTQAYRQSVGTNAGMHPENVPYSTDEKKPKRVGYDGVAIQLERRQQPASQAIPDDEEEEEEYDDVWPTRVPSSARWYVQTLPQAPHYQVHPDQVQHIPKKRRGQANRAIPPDVIYAGDVSQHATHVQPRQKISFFRRAHPLLWVGLGMLFMLGAWVGWQTFSAWWSIHLDDVTYGRPRTAQYDVVVGHNDSPTNKTHLVVFNINTRVVILEIPGGDTSKAMLYQGPQIFGTNADLDPVTLTFSDVNHTGKPIMIVNVQGAHILYLNQNGKFVLKQSH